MIVRALRSDVQKQLETLRVAGKIGSSLAGEVDLYANGAETDFLGSFADDLRFVFITSQARLRHDSAGDTVDSVLPGVRLKVFPRRVGAYAESAHTPSCFVIVAPCPDFRRPWHRPGCLEDMSTGVI